MRILLTGGSGFVGRAVLKTLVKHRELKIEVVSRGGNDDFFSQVGVIFHKFDYIRKSDYQEKLLSKFDVLIHCAWEGLPRKSLLLNNKNLEGTTKLFKDFVRFGGQKIISIGSCLEYGGAVGKISEEFSGENVGSFGLTKRKVLGCLKDIDCDYAWIRPFFLYGPNQHADSLLRTTIDKGLKTDYEWLTNPRKRNDFTYVGDVANLIFQILESNSYIEEINLGSSVSRRNIDFVNLIKTNLGLPTLDIGLDSEDGMESSNSKLLKYFPKFMITKLEDGLNETLEFHKKGI